MENEEIISVREAFDRCYPPEITRPRFKRKSSKTIVCFNCQQDIKQIKVKEGKGLCPFCGTVLFEKLAAYLEQKEPREKFWVLKRAFLAYKQGKYTEQNLLNFFAGFCGYAPTSEEDLKIKEEN